MDMSPNDQFLEAARRDGWTPARKAQFLALLAETGNVRLTARRCRLSAQSAYVQRRRDRLFARGWASALWLARDHAEQVLADRAIEGVEEEIWYRGERVGTRRRYDSRLLLAHLARLDRQAEARDAAEDADRFDELVALVAGVTPGTAMAGDDDGLPPLRADHAERAAEVAERKIVAALFEEEDDDDEDGGCGPGGDADAGAAADAEKDPYEIVAETTAAARAAAEAAWDDWRARACAALDQVVAQDSVNLSTSLPCGATRAESARGSGTDPSTSD